MAPARRRRSLDPWRNGQQHQHQLSLTSSQNEPRVRAMLTRWTNEALPDETEWNIEDIEPMRLDRNPNHPGK